MMRSMFVALSLLAGQAVAAPPDPMLYGRAFLAEGDYASAVQSFADALRLNPNDPAALNNMGVARAAAGDYQAALEFLLRAERIAPHRGDIRDNLARLVEWTRNYGAASASLPTPSAALSPEPPAPWPLAPNQAAGMRPPPQLFSDCPTSPCK